MIRVGPQRVVAMRYIMKNSTEEVLVNTLEQEPVTFTFGSGKILPALEQPLTGLKIGEQKSFRLTPESSPGLDQTYYFDVIIDDIRWDNGDEPEPEDVGISLQNSADDCGPDCNC
ncbi:MAG: FKBP-type peptidyl-prolyl cis-trans isomerase [Cyclobacteriaceae bacterium]